MSRWTLPSASTAALLLLVICSAAEGKPTIRKSGDATTSEESTAAKQAVIRVTAHSLAQLSHSVKGVLPESCLCA